MRVKQFVVNNSAKINILNGQDYTFEINGRIYESSDYDLFPLSQSEFKADQLLEHFCLEYAEHHEDLMTDEFYETLDNLQSKLEQAFIN